MVRLVRMFEAEHQAYHELTIREHAEHKVQAGNWRKRWKSRRKGYAEQALHAVEERAKALGLDTIVLRVFGHNHAARALYEKLGYEITNINMAKKD